jgi:competence protein ComEC
MRKCVELSVFCDQYLSFENQKTMIRLRIGFFLSGIITGLIVLVSFLTSFSDTRLTMVFCNVGQGDGFYVRFPDGRDMVVDAGPSKKILSCLSRHMPFWDRTIDIVVATHPEADHIGGLPEVLSRYDVGYLVRSDIRSDTDIAQKVDEIVRRKQIKQRLVTAGDLIRVGDVTLSIEWPTIDQVTKMRSSSPVASAQSGPSILGVSTGNLNEGGVVMLLSYGTFDALLMADADSGVNGKFASTVRPADGVLDIVKIPHHGAKLAFSDTMIPLLFHNSSSNQNQDATTGDFSESSLARRPPARHRLTAQSLAGGLSRLNSSMAVISVGKNSYGHPAKELVEKLTAAGAVVRRTDMEGDIVITTDGKNIVKN